MDQLQIEIDAMSKSIKTDSYTMSIGEIAGLYKDGDLDIAPIYQRLFRWDINQQSMLIESILLQIPIPPIYVFQSEDGKWSLIDGQQRLSTIFKFMGILRIDHDGQEDEEDNEDKLSSREPLSKTKFLPALEGKFWEDDDPSKSLTEAQRRYIKRSKLTVIIIDKSSDSFAQYEMFQRLNTGGSHLSAQEIRNCILVMKNPEVFSRLRNMSEYQNFRDAIPLSEKDTEEQGYLELVVKFIILRHSDFQVSDSENFNNFITDEIIKLIESSALDLNIEEDSFRRTFNLIKAVEGENAFKRFDANKNTHQGAVLVGAFEAIIPGLTSKIEMYTAREDVKEKIDNIYLQNDYLEATKRGVRPVGRIKKLASFSKEYF